MTPKREAFCLAYVETGNASEAYRRAYDAERMSDQVVHNKASALLATGEIRVRVADLQGQHAERHNVTVDSLTEKLERAYKIAETNNQSSAMTQAVMGMAKIHGHVVDKREDVTKISRAERIARTAELLERIGVGGDSGRH